MTPHVPNRPTAPSWSVVALSLLIAAAGWVASNGPGMIGRSGDRALQLRPTDFDALSSARAQLSAELRELEQRQAHLLWADSLVPLTLAAHDAGEPIAIGRPEGLAGGDTDPDEIRETLRHPALRPVHDQEVALGLFAMVMRRSEDVILHGEDAGQPWCILVTAIPARALERTHFPRINPVRSDRTPTLLGGCSWILRYGVPGRHLKGWIAERGIRNRPTGYYGVGRSLLARDPLGIDQLLTGSGISRPLIENRACRYGVAEACLREWGPATPGPAPEVGPGVHLIDLRHRTEYRSGSVSAASGDILSRLENAFGEEALYRFWSSDQPVAVAFEEAFGLHPNDWVRRDALEISGPVRAGPIPRLGAVVPSLLLLLASTLVGVLYTRLRSVE